MSVYILYTVLIEFEAKKSASFRWSERGVLAEFLILPSILISSFSIAGQTLLVFHLQYS